MQIERNGMSSDGKIVFKRIDLFTDKLVDPVLRALEKNKKIEIPQKT